MDDNFQLPSQEAGKPCPAINCKNDKPMAVAGPFCRKCLAENFRVSECEMLINKEFHEFPEGLQSKCIRLVEGPTGEPTKLSDF